MQFHTLLEKLSWGEIHDAEAHINQVFRVIGVKVSFTKHFIDRINDERNEKDITVKELEGIFDKALKSYAGKIHDMKDHHNALITDTDTWVNVPFVIEKDRRGNLSLIAKTIMRTKKFHTSRGEKKFFVK